jgi:poly(3-hydroxybutyrate) depolymerase
LLRRDERRVVSLLPSLIADRDSGSLDNEVNAVARQDRSSGWRSNDARDGGTCGLLAPLGLAVALAAGGCSGDDNPVPNGAAGASSGGTGSTSTGGSGAGGMTGTGGDTAGAGGSSETPSSGCGQSPPPLGDIVDGPTWGVNPDYTYTIDVNGTERSYVLRYPDSYDSSHPYPVVFLFHGTGGSGQEYDYTRVEQAAAAGGALFVLPVGLDYEWAQDTGWETFNDNERDLEFFDAMWDRIRSEYCVDELRVFASGHSIGGYMSNYLACQRGDVVRAIAPIAGGGMNDWYLSNHDCVGQVAVKVIHGTADSVVTFDNGTRVRDYFIGANHCDTAASPTSHPPCEQHADCDPGFAVEMCAFDGIAHSDFDWPALGPTIWEYFAGF